jgi:hypothetical protein
MKDPVEVVDLFQFVLRVLTELLDVALVRKEEFALTRLENLLHYTLSVRE